MCNASRGNQFMVSTEFGIRLDCWQEMQVSTATSLFNSAPALYTTPPHTHTHTRHAVIGPGCDMKYMIVSYTKT